MDEELVSLLFSTHAFKVADSENPFWYTSGKLGPYFINVDYLYGSQKDSEDLLKIIDDLLANSDKEDLPGKLYEILLNHYETNEIFKTTIDKLVEYIENNFQLDLIDYISGGERRDWYFSILVANFLGKPHITIYKDLTTVFSTSDFEETNTIQSLPGKRVFHLADILNTGSSFERAWVPAINKLGSKINWALFVVDRNQSGDKNMQEIGVQPYALLSLNEDLLNIALKNKIITQDQKAMLIQYMKDPDGTMRRFIELHPNFIDDTINNSENEKSIKRAKLCKEKNWYGSPLGDE